jgi:hypothetical protein
MLKKSVILIKVAEHQAPVKSCRWLKANNYSALMTCSWDKTLKGRRNAKSKYLTFIFCHCCQFHIQGTFALNRIFVKYGYFTLGTRYVPYRTFFPVRLGIGYGIIFRIEQFRPGNIYLKLLFLIK